MDIKTLNKTSNPNSGKVVNAGGKSFKLWLEFEETSPWDDMEDDFANISVDTLDGRSYGINIWTYKFLERAVRHDRESDQNLNGLYLIPPDLFVRELSRDCIEKTISDLLESGNLEQILNTSVFGLEFLPPYTSAMDAEESLFEHLQNELAPGLSDVSVFQNESPDLIAWKSDQDSFVLELEDGRIVVVDRVGNLKREKEEFSQFRVYQDKMDFWHKEMRQEILGFKN